MGDICMGCMNPLPDGSEKCAVCGYPANGQNPAHCLPVRSILQEHYLIGRLVHEGCDSLVYLGFDRQLKEPCFIREYYPSGLCERGADGTLAALGGCERPYAAYLEDTRALMRALARVKDLPAMIPVYDIFEENGTVYAVSDYHEGTTLTKKIAQAGGRLPWSEARPLFMTLMSCVSQLHSAHIRHLAICPDNILIGQDGKAHLLNFGLEAARSAGHDLGPELHEGYSAPEQYRMDAPMTDAADVYGLAATIFRTVTGNVPPAGDRRAKDSDDLFMSAEIAEELTQQVCVALFGALLVDPAQRTQSVARLREQLSLEPNLSALRDEAEEDRAPLVDEKEPKKGVSPVLIVLLCALAALLVAGGVAAVLLLGDRGQQKDPVSSNVVLPTLPVSTTAPKKETKYAVPKLTGKLYYDIDPDGLSGGMTVEILYKQYSDKPNGTVISQEPKAGTGVEKGQVIKIVVSCGKDDKVVVPDVSGWKEEHARLYLQALGFRVEVAQLQASSYEKGLVDSTDPQAGTEKKVGDVITLRVSNVEQTSNTEPDPDYPSDNGGNEGGFGF